MIKETFNSASSFAQEILNASTALIMVVDCQGKVVCFNKACEKLSGYKTKDKVGNDCWEICASAEEAEEVKRLIDLICQKKSKIKGENNIVTANGVTRLISWSGSVILGDDNEVKFIIATGNDITELRATEEKLKKSEEQFRWLAENARDIIFKVNCVGHILVEYISPAIAAVAGYQPEEFYDSADLIINIVLPQYRDKIKGLLQGKYNKRDIICLQSKSGGAVYIEILSVPFFNGDGKLIAVEGIARDVTERHRLSKRLEFLSFHDAMTGIYNRCFFENEMYRLTQKKYLPVSMIIVDLDCLKLVNDTFGHKMGDKMIKEAADLLGATIKKQGNVARIGGDEFAIILPTGEKQQVENICRQISITVDKYNEERKNIWEFSLSMSIGYAIRNGKEKSMVELYKEADNQMYRAKLHRVKKANTSVMNNLKQILRMREYTVASENLKKVIVKIGKSIGMAESSVFQLQMLADFHDIGKAGLTEKVFYKPGKLTEEERMEMQRHCEVGYRIACTTVELMPIAQLILKHHEWWNGQGYPLGLQGEQIHLENRIFSILNAYYAMINERPYRSRFSHSEAVAELYRFAGLQFDPELVPVIISVLEKE